MDEERINLVKQFLRKGYKINERMMEKVQEIKDIREIATSIPGIDYSRERVQSSKSSGDAGFVDVISKICEFEGDVKKSLADLVQIKIDIRNAINQLEDAKEISVLTFRYILFCTWDEICCEMNLSSRSIHRIHVDALKNLAKLEMFQKEGDAA